MINIKDKCGHIGCRKIPSFNLPNETKGLYCSEHKSENMINVMSRLCVHIGCNKYPFYNLPNETKGLYCSDHKSENMINVTSRRCVHTGCNKHPVYNLPTETMGSYCFVHKSENMIDVKNERCIHTGCSKRPTFNLATETKGLYCVEHKIENMIDVKNKRCVYAGCNKRPSFNLPTENRELYCVEHKSENMIDVRTKRCIYDGCSKTAAFNLPKETKGLYCFEHKKENMVNVKTKQCIHDDCNKQSSFNHPTETISIYCASHKLSGMVNVKLKTCQSPKCKSNATHGLIGKRKQFCETHTQPNMINLDVEYKCSQCEKNYDFIVDNDKYCLEHCPNKGYEIKLKKKCKYCDIEEASNFVCSDCRQRSTKKEWMVIRYIKKHIDTPCVHNSVIAEQSCSLKRPDILFDLPTHTIIVEVDENQHKAYMESCECARINELVNSIGGKPIVFIRFNPDNIYNTFVSKTEIKIPLLDRLSELIKVIKRELITEYTKFSVKVIQLYYDDNYDVYNPIKMEDITDKVAI